MAASFRSILALNWLGGVARLVYTSPGYRVATITAYKNRTAAITNLNENQVI